MKLKLMLAALAAAGTMGSAQATVQTYDFSVTVDQVRSDNDQGWFDSGEGSSAGTTVNKGDLIKGRVSFDDAIPLFQITPPISGNAAAYEYNSGLSYAFKLDYTFVRIAQKFAANSGVIRIENDGFFGDTLMISATGDYPPPGPMGRIYLSGGDRSTFLNSAIPSDLTIDPFIFPIFMASWQRGSDGGQMAISSRITSLVRVNDVPEPASAALMLAALAGMGVAARRNRKAVSAHA